MTATVQNALQIVALGGLLTCEEAFLFIMREIAKVRGRKHAKPTVQQRHMMLRIHTLAHQYRTSTGAVALSTARFGENIEAASQFIKMLEEAGCIKQVDGYWRRDKNHKQNCKSAHYNVDPLFLSAIDFIADSVSAGYDECYVPKKWIKSYKCNLRYSKFSTNTSNSTKSYNPPILFPSGQEFPRTVLDAENSGLKRCGLHSLSKREIADARRRRNRIARLWGQVTPDEEELIRGKVKLQCHSLAIGAEVPDLAIEKEIRRKYAIPRIEKYLAEADAALPPEYHSRFSINIKRDKHKNVYGIGTRCYNKLCSTKNEEKPDSIRPEILEELGLGADHKDVHCSIYSVYKALKTHYFLPADVYTALGEKLGCTRVEIKKTIMRANFGCFASQASRNPFGKRAQCRIKGSNIQYGAFQRAMRSIDIEPMGTDTSVFYHEGAIYAIARVILLREYGIRSICVYDSFYLSKAISDNQLLSVLNKALAVYEGRIDMPSRH